MRRIVLLLFWIAQKVDFTPPEWYTFNRNIHAMRKKSTRMRRLQRAVGWCETAGEEAGNSLPSIWLKWQ